MAFEALAYGPEAKVLLVVDGAELLAYDALTEAPQWQVTFAEPLLSVLFAHPHALPTAGEGSPWREAATTHAAIALDAEGSIHAVDLTRGMRVGSVGPFGKPRAVASCVTTGALAVAVGDRVLVWRSGHLVEVPLRRASALAFSADGSTLAAGTDAGDVILLSLDAPTVPAAPSEMQPQAATQLPVRTLEATGVGPVADLVQHPSGPWISAGAHGVFVITAKGAEHVAKIPGGVVRACFDAAGAALAVQRNERAIVVYAWPARAVIARIEYTERPVRGMAFGPESWLGVALDHGDGNKIDIVTSATHRTDTAPGKMHRSWTLLVEGQRKLLSEKEAEEIRRMKSPFHEPEAPRGRGHGAGGKIGIGAFLSLALIGLRLCVHASGSSHSTYYDNASTHSTPPYGGTCDAACAKSRVVDLETDCTINTALACAADAAEADKALAEGRCEDALVAVKRIPSSAAVAGSASVTPLFGAHRLLAQFGIEEACRSGAIRPPPAVKHTRLIRFSKNAVNPRVEVLPEQDFARGESPSALFTAPDGTVFAATLTESPQQCVVYKRSTAGSWQVGFSARSPTGDVSLFGRSASDVYLAAGNTIAHFDGVAWSTVPSPNEDLLDGAATVGGDLFVAAGVAEHSSAVRRRHGGAWTKEPTPSGVSFLALHGAGTSLWAIGEDDHDRQVLVRRAPGGGWSTRMPGSDGASPLALRALWASPNGEVFVGTSSSVLRSTDAGVSWSEEQRPDAVASLWGRSAADVYGLEGSDLVHFDGKSWSKITGDVAGARALSGTATDVLVLGSGGP